MSHLHHPCGHIPSAGPINPCWYDCLLERSGARQRLEVASPKERFRFCFLTSTRVPETQHTPTETLGFNPARVTQSTGEISVTLRTSSGSSVSTALRQTQGRAGLCLLRIPRDPPSAPAAWGPLPSWRPLTFGVAHPPRPHHRTIHSHCECALMT